MRVLVLNGPNLNLLGTREPEVYGTTTLVDLENMIVTWGKELEIEVETAQTNHEGVLVDQIQRDDIDGVVLNAGAYTHTSRAIADAIAGVDTPVVEVHISNIKQREPWRAVSLLADACSASIYGRGVDSYRHALRHLVNRGAVPYQEVRYGPENDHIGDVRGEGDTIVVLVHGGFWRGEWTRDTMESLAVDLAQSGVASFNIEYRRLGEDGGWPAMAEDVQMALDHVPALALHQSRVVVVGHSAGGYLSLWSAWRSSTQIDQLVGMSPIVDLERHSKSQMFGAEEAQTLLDNGAPRRISAGGVPTLLVHGEADRHVPIGHSADLAREDGLELLTTSTGHFELLDPSQPHWVTVKEVIRG